MASSESNFRRSLPASVKRLSLFEDFNKTYSSTLQAPSWSIIGPFPDRPVEPALAEAIAHRSLDLEQLYVSFMIDAEKYFEACQPNWKWNNLRSIVLTCRSLVEKNAAEPGFPRLLSRAAVVARQMPSLTCMVLYNASKCEACSFTYLIKDKSRASLAWRGTWGVPERKKLLFETVTQWSSTARSHLRTLGYAARAGTFSHRVIAKKRFVSHGDAIHWLKLPRGVIDPVSLWQIRREGILEEREV